MKCKNAKIGPKMVTFGPIWTQFRSKQLKIQPGSHFCSDRLDRIDSIGSTQSYWLDWIDSIRSNWLQKWLPGQILGCLDLNWVQIGPKMAFFGPIWTQFRSKQLKIQPGSHFWSDRLDQIKLTTKMASWSNFKLFRPKLSPNRTKNGHFWSDLDLI